LYVCGIWYRNTKADYHVQVSDNDAFRKMFGLRKNKKMEQFMIFCNEKRRNFYRPSGIFKTVKSG
jgi:hypothetical protein